MLLLFFKNHNKKNYRLVLPPLPPPRPFPPRPRLLPPRGARPPRGDEDINKFCTGKTLEFELSSVKACSSALSWSPNTEISSSSVGVEKSCSVIKADPPTFSVNHFLNFKNQFELTNIHHLN